MNLHVLYEFVEFSKYMNFSSASRMLHLSQSTLSKHIADLEKSLGFPLVIRKNIPTLTPAGKVFLESVEDILFNYERTVEHCKGMQHTHEGRIVIQDPLIDATIAHQSFGVFVHFSENYPSVVIDLHTVKGETVTESLKAGRVDVGYLMAYGDHESVIKKRAEIGIAAIPLRERRFGAWLRKDHPLARKEKLFMPDLKEVPFLIPADRLFDDWRTVLEQASLSHGFAPKINLKVTPTINGYFALNIRNGVVILSEGFLQDPRFLMRDDMTTHELAGEKCSYTLYTVYCEDNPNPILPLFIDQIQKVSDFYQKDSTLKV